VGQSSLQYRCQILQKCNEKRILMDEMYFKSKKSIICEPAYLQI
jgi:hypothetical protein